MKIYLIKNEDLILFNPPLTEKSLFKIFKVDPMGACKFSKFNISLDLDDNNKLFIDYFENPFDLTHFNTQDKWINSTSKSLTGKINIENMNNEKCNFQITLIVLENDSEIEKNIFKIYEQSIVNGNHEKNFIFDDQYYEEKAFEKIVPIAENVISTEENKQQDVEENNEGVIEEDNEGVIEEDNEGVIEEDNEGVIEDGIFVEENNSKLKDAKKNDEDILEKHKSNYINKSSSTTSSFLSNKTFWIIIIGILILFFILKK